MSLKIKEVIDIAKSGNYTNPNGSESAERAT
jgi:hypothetical protein